MIVQFVSQLSLLEIVFCLGIILAKWVLYFKKFHLGWKGIFRVIAIEGIHATITSCNSPQSNPRRVHINQLKKNALKALVQSAQNCS